MAKIFDRKTWVQFGIQLVVVVALAGVAWGTITQDLCYTKERVTKLEKTLETLTKANVNMALDIREIKTILTTRLSNGE